MLFHSKLRGKIDNLFVKIIQNEDGCNNLLATRLVISIFYDTQIIIILTELVIYNERK